MDHQSFRRPINAHVHGRRGAGPRRPHAEACYIQGKRGSGPQQARARQFAVREVSVIAVPVAVFRVHHASELGARGCVQAIAGRWGGQLVYAQPGRRATATSIDYQLTVQPVLRERLVFAVCTPKARHVGRHRLQTVPRAPRCGDPAVVVGTTAVRVFLPAPHRVLSAELAVYRGHVRVPVPLALGRRLVVLGRHRRGLGHHAFRAKLDRQPVCRVHGQRVQQVMHELPTQRGTKLRVPDRGFRVPGPRRCRQLDQIVRHVPDHVLGAQLDRHLAVNVQELFEYYPRRQQFLDRQVLVQELGRGRGELVRVHADVTDRLENHLAHAVWNLFDRRPRLIQRHHGHHVLGLKQKKTQIIKLIWAIRTRTFVITPMTYFYFYFYFM